MSPQQQPEAQPPAEEQRHQTLRLRPPHLRMLDPLRPLLRDRWPAVLPRTEDDPVKVLAIGAGQQIQVGGADEL